MQSTNEIPWEWIAIAAASGILGNLAWAVFLFVGDLLRRGLVAGWKSAKEILSSLSLANTVSGLGIVAGVLSLVQLAQVGLEVGFQPVLLSLLNYYHSVMSAVFAPFEELIRPVVDLVGPLPSGWRDVFVLFVLLVASVLRSTWWLHKRPEDEERSKTFSSRFSYFVLINFLSVLGVLALLLAVNYGLSSFGL